ncbi:thioredoxin domain-containing protein [Litoribrevibacter albus]|uniref:Spermatogenesis-associated protein 20-like TRX domain-containing protein n=1 Tax=Litoribrevibacter albus TaxID=1473156 RepID=A0AA37SA61_9GAMM|nr:DUF255 domain-containing protein [Litoribrevibacter albus]GLQ32122.1 hypothetical protein GCM10007876_26010 [Litoribrevibacter albus]
MLERFTRFTAIKLSQVPVYTMALCLFMGGHCYALSALSLQAPPSSDIAKDSLQVWRHEFESKQTLMTGLLEDHMSPQSIHYINGLILENSPYLLKHAVNPINWQPWSENVFLQAKEQKKLVFLSIGYSSCHWCNVMEKESFNDLGIAGLLADDYIAVKVDREERPDVDSYYTSVLQEVLGTSGWPISVILNAAGDPLFAASYLPKHKLSTLLPRLSRLMKTNADLMNTNAKQITALVKERYTRVQSATWDPKVLETTTNALKKRLDPVTGGYKGAPKFPNEAMLLFALERLSHEYDDQLAELVKLQLANMMSKAMYDHVNGGFHRYVTDDQWLLPHFEKMLYNQAQLLMVYSKAYQLFADPLYLAVINDLFRFSSEHLYGQGEGFYTSINAVYQKQDGGFYTWKPAELDSLLRNFESRTLVQRYALPGTNLQGVYFSAPFDPKNSDLKHLLKERREGSPEVDKKVITAWNGLMINGLANAYSVTGNEKMKALAISTAHTIWRNHFDAAQNRLIRSSFQGKTNHRGQLSDYSYLANAFLKIHELTEDDVWLKRTQKLVDIVSTYFTAGNGSFYSSDERKTDTWNAENQNVNDPQSVSENLTTFQRHQYFRDGELFAGNSVMLEVMHNLWLRTGNGEIGTMLLSMKETIKSYFDLQPFDNLYAGKVLTEISQGATEHQQYFAMGKGYVEFNYQRASCDLPANLEFSIKLKDGWHMNSSSPNNQYLIPTRLTVDSGLIKVDYPKDSIRKLTFSEQALRVYQGQFRILAQAQTNSLSKLKLDLQVCGDRQCLAPQSINFMLAQCQS